MEDCASSSSSASSSSTAVDENEILAPSYFPCNLKMKSMRLFVRNLSYSGHVNLVDEGEPLWCTCHFKMARPSRDRFAIVGDLAKLETDGRRFCTGDITAIDHDAAGLSTVLQIRVPSARGCFLLLFVMFMDGFGPSSYVLRWILRLQMVDCFLNLFVHLFLSFQLLSYLNQHPTTVLNCDFAQHTRC